MPLRPDFWIEMDMNHYYVLNGICSLQYLLAQNKAPHCRLSWGVNCDTAAVYEWQKVTQV